MPTQKKGPSLDKQQIVSAQVVLRPESGKSIRGNVPITSQNLRDYLPSAEITKKIAQAFTENGFTVGSLIGNSFSISGSVKVFEGVFKTRLLQEERGAFLAIGRDQAAGPELPLSSLPKEISNYIEAVTFTPPPDFGPTPSGSW